MESSGSYAAVAPLRDWKLSADRREVQTDALGEWRHLCVDMQSRDRRRFSVQLEFMKTEEF